MPTPLRNTGPAIVTYNGVSWYFKSGLEYEVVASTSPIQTDAFGEIAKVFKDRMIKLSGTPVGVIRSGDIAGQMPFQPANIGASIFGATDTTLTVQTINDGQAITWTRGAIGKYAPMLLSATKGTIYSGNMEFYCLMASTFTLTGASAWNSITSAAFADTTFDQSKVRMGQYVAAWGSTSPFNSMIAEEGFTFTPELSVKPLNVDNYGIIDYIVDSVTCSASFKAANLSEANVETMLALQGSGAMVPGAAIGDGGNSLIITGPHLVATMPGAAPFSSKTPFGKGKLRYGELKFASVTTFTSGVPNAVFSFTVS